MKAKKLISLLLAVLMICSVFSCLGVTASAQTNNSGTYLNRSGSHGDDSSDDDWENKNFNVDSISFTPITPYEIIENSHGRNSVRYDEEMNEVKYWEYTLPVYKEGDIFTVTDKEDITTSYVYTVRDDEGYFAAENGEELPESEVEMFSSQYDTPWVKGSDNYLIIQYGQTRYNVPVSIIESNIKSISYTSAIPLEIPERTKGDVDFYVNSEGVKCPFWFYYVPNYANGDILTINYTDDTSVNYTCYYDGSEREFVSDNGTRLDTEDLSLTTDQYTKPWKVGTDNYITITYLDKQCKVSVRITETTIDSISYTPANIQEYIIHTHGSIAGTYDDDNNEIEFWKYDLPNFRRGDILTINRKDNSPVEYICTYSDDSNTLDFISADGDIINFSMLTASDDQKINQWKIGTENYYTVAYSGFECKVPVTILENPVATVEYTPVKPLKYILKTNGEKGYRFDTTVGDEVEYWTYYLPKFSNGDVFTTYGKDGTVIDYIYTDDGDCFISSAGEVITEDELYKYSRQLTKPWVMGDGNILYIDYQGLVCEANVEIIESPVESILFQPVKPVEIIENTNGEDDWYYDKDLEEKVDYWSYDIPSFYEGDALVVDYKDGTKKTYTFNPGIEGFISDDEEVISLEDDLIIRTEQSRRPWKLGKDNYYSVDYLGKECRVPVTVKENHLSSIEFTPVSTIEYVECTNGDKDLRYDSETDEDVEFWSYYLPNFRDGDVLTLNHKSGDIVSYTYQSDKWGFVSENGDIIPEKEVKKNSNQLQTPWLRGDKNYFDVDYLNHICQVSVTIKESPVDSIEFTPAEPYKIIEKTNGGYYWGINSETGEDEEYWYYYLPTFADGDVLTVNYKSSVKTSYTYSQEQAAFVSEDDEAIGGSLVRFISTQSENHWSKDKDNFYGVKYLDVDFNVPVTIIENAVTSISYTPAISVEIVENTNGELSYYYDAEIDDYVEKWVYFIPDFYHGDSMTVGYNDESVVTFVYSKVKGYFVGDNGDRINLNDIDRTSGQLENGWTIGDDNYYIIKYLDNTCNVPVTITEYVEPTTTVTTTEATTEPTTTVTETTTVSTTTEPTTQTATETTTEPTTQTLAESTPTETTTQPTTQVTTTETIPEITEPAPTPQQPVAKTVVTLKKSKATIYVKATVKIALTVKNGKGKTTFKSANSKIAKVNAKGVVTGIKKGTTTITVKNNGVIKKFKVTVKKPVVSPKKKTLKKGNSFTIKVKGKVGKAKFTTSNKKVASVNSKGKVVARKKGKAVITVKTNGLKYKINVTVR